MFREVDVVEVREVLRGWQSGVGLRVVAERAGVDRKTARRYVAAAQAAGLERGDGAAPPSDAVVGAVIAAVRPARPNGHGVSWDALEGRKVEVTGWVREGLSVVKIHELLARAGVVVPYRTVHRFASLECGFRARGTTVRVADGTPGVECQIDFAQLGYLVDGDGRRRRVHALIFTSVFSRHMFVHLTFRQTLADVIAGCEAAWEFFGGVFKVLVPDNMSCVVAAAEPTNPRFTAGWLDYAQHAGFVTDPARVQAPKDKARVERIVQYVRNNFFAGEAFPDLHAAQQAAGRWCLQTAGERIHGTTGQRPLGLFTEQEAGLLLPVPARYDVPLLREVKVHRDFHIEVGKALYSVPGHLIGTTLTVRADSRQVRLFHRGQLVKVHPRQPVGGRHTDRDDLPAERSGYAMRDLDRLVATAAAAGENIGIYAARLLDEPLPWTRMRAVYRLLGLIRRYGPEPVDTACGTALALDVIAVGKIDAMLAKALESTVPAAPAAVNGGRFARDPGEYRRPPTPATTDPSGPVGGQR